jgi:aspartate aminotransferase-like enzyme
VFQVVLDGVCAVASEEIRFDDWGIDVVISATQKSVDMNALSTGYVLNL